MAEGDCKELIRAQGRISAIWSIHHIVEIAPISIPETLLEANLTACEQFMVVIGRTTKIPSIFEMLGPFMHQRESIEPERVNFNRLARARSDVSAIGGSLHISVDALFQRDKKLLQEFIVVSDPQIVIKRVEKPQYGIRVAIVARFWLRACKRQAIREHPISKIVFILLQDAQTLVKMLCCEEKAGQGNQCIARAMLHTKVVREQRWNVFRLAKANALFFAGSGCFTIHKKVISGLEQETQIFFSAGIGIGGGS